MTHVDVDECIRGVRWPRVCARRSLCMHSDEKLIIEMNFAPASQRLLRVRPSYVNTQQLSISASIIDRRVAQAHVQLVGIGLFSA